MNEDIGIRKHRQNRGFNLVSHEVRLHQWHEIVQHQMQLDKIGLSGTAGAHIMHAPYLGMVERPLPEDGCAQSA